MKRERKPMVIGVISLILIIFVALASTVYVAIAPWIFGHGHIKIRRGFSTVLVDDLKTKYEITIPKNAKFIKGINTNGRESEVVILFSCPTDGNTDIYKILGLSPQRWGGGGAGQGERTDWFDEMGGLLDNMIEDKNNAFTFISYSFRGGKVIIRIVGHHPGRQYP